MQQAFQTLRDTVGDEISFGNAFDIEALLEQQIELPTLNYLQANATPDTFNLLEAMRDAGLEAFGGETAAPRELSFDVNFEEQVNLASFQLDLGAEADALGFSAQSAIASTITLDLAFSFTYGLKLDETSLIDPNVSFDDAFFVRDVDLQLSGDLDFSGSFDASVGIADVTATIAPGDMVADVDLQIGIANNQQDAEGNVTLEQLTSTSLPNLFDVSTVNDIFTASVELSGNIGSYVIPGSPRVDITGSPLSNAAPSVTVTDFGPLEDLSNLDAGDLLLGIGALGGLFVAIGDSPLLDVPVPFTEETLGSLFDFDTSFQEQLNQLTDADGIPIFSAQTFGFGETTSVDFDPTARELRFDITLDMGTLAQSLPFQFGGVVDQLNSLLSGSAIDITSGLSTSFSIVVDLSNPIEPAATVNSTSRAARGSGEPDDFVTPTQAISLSNFQILGGLEQSLSSFSADGVFGFVGLDIGSGRLDGLLDFDLSLVDGRSLSDILIGLGNPEELLSIDLSGATELALGSIQTLENLVPVPSGAELRLRVQDFATQAIELIPTNIGDLVDVADISFDQIFDLLESQFVDDLIEDLQAKVDNALTVLQTRVSDIVDSSIGELVRQIRSTLEDIRETGTATLQTLLAQLEQSVELEGLVDLAFTSTFDSTTKTLLLSLDIQKDLLGTQRFDYDFAPFSRGSGVATLGDFSLDGDLLWDATANLSLDVGLDVSNPTKPTPFVLDTTRFDASLFTSSNLSGELHGLGLTFAADGIGRISSTTNPARPATFAVTLDGFTDGRLAFANFDPRAINTEFDGMLDLDLETELLPSTSQRTQPFHLVINDLSDPIGTAEVLESPDFQQFIDDLSLSQLIASLASGIDELLGRIETAIDSAIGVVPLPLVNGSLDPANAVARFHEFLQPALDALATYDPESLKDAIEGALEDAFGDTFTVRIDDSDPRDIQLSILSRGADRVTASIDSNLGLPALGAQIQGDVQINADHEFQMVFGVNLTDGVYLKTDSRNELDLNLDVLYDGVLTGRLGFLDISVSNANPGSTAFDAGLSIDLKDPNNDGKLTVSELSEFRFADHIMVETNADIDLAFAFETQIRGIEDLPSIVAQLDIDWDIVNAITSGETADDFGGLPVVSFTNVGLNLGEFLTEFAEPFLLDVFETVEPILPIIEALTSPLPILSDIAEQDVTLVDTVQAIFPNQNLEFLDTINAVINVLAAIDVAKSETGEILLSFEDLSFGFTDLREPDALDAAGIVDFLLTPNAQAPWESLFDSPIRSVESFATSVQSSPGAFDFALLSKPSRVFELLLGLRDDVELVTWDVPALSVYAPIDLSYTVFPFVNVGFFGALRFEADINVGYDTLGISNFLRSNQVIDLFDGFFISDTANGDGTGPDVPEALVTGELKPQVSIGVPGVVDVGIAGGLTANLGADLVDPSGDGKVRATEFLHPGDCLFAMGGEIGIELDFFARVAGQRHSLPFAYAEIANYNLTPECPYLVDPFTDVQETLAVLERDGTLRLLVGDLASRRSVEQSETDEVYVVQYDMLNNNVHVQAFGHVQTFNALSISSIAADAGSGDDALRIVVPHSVEVSGGTGDDLIEVFGAILREGSPETVGAIHVQGNSGEDSIRAMVGTQTIIDGGDGNDVLQAIGGANEFLAAQINGGEGDDVIQAGFTADIIDGGAGDDLINAGDGDNVITTGTGDDLVSTGAGEDTIHAQGGGLNRISTNGGDDIVNGGRDRDEIHVGPGDDTVFGGSGNDLIVGGPGEDELEGQNGEDRIFGDEDDDTIRGGLNNDELYGGPGEDEIDGDSGADFIDGGSHDDTLRGGTSNDEILGDAGNDTIEGNSGNDTLRGGSGNDTINGNDQNDEIYGDSGDDEIHGDDGMDWVDGGLGRDEIHGNDGMDELNGGPNDDRIFGDAGDDKVDGGDGNDEIFGDTGNDLLEGGDGDDEIYGERDNDDLRGGLGNDKIFGGPGQDQADGGDGNDLVNGEQDADILRGGQDNDLLLGFGGDDRIFGGPGLDILRGGAGNDWLDGGDDDDRAYGGEGQNVFAAERATTFSRPRLASTFCSAMKATINSMVARSRAGFTVARAMTNSMRNMD